VKTAVRLISMGFGIFSTCVAAQAIMPVPEPGTLSLVGLALGAIAYWGARKK
jgi:PEP-CTERM motif